VSAYIANKINLGMYAETLVQRSCDYYRLHHIAYIEKRQLPIKIIKRINETTIVGKLLNKSYVDFFGCHHGKHLEFEVKETGNDDLLISILKPHQLEYLNVMTKQNIWCFLVVYFSKYDELYRIDFS
jgi:recombination protein U